MKFLILSERSDQELCDIADLARETSIGNALYTYGFTLVDLEADHVGFLLLSIQLDDIDRNELHAWWQRHLEEGLAVMSVSKSKTPLEAVNTY